MINTVLKQEVDESIKQIAEEQVLILKHKYKMKPADIIRMYSGCIDDNATYDDAVDHVAVFNLMIASKNGFVASY